MLPKGWPLFTRYRPESCNQGACGWNQQQSEIDPNLNFRADCLNLMVLGFENALEAMSCSCFALLGVQLQMAVARECSLLHSGKKFHDGQCFAIRSFLQFRERSFKSLVT